MNTEPTSNAEMKHTPQAIGPATIAAAKWIKGPNSFSPFDHLAVDYAFAFSLEKENDQLHSELVTAKQERDKYLHLAAERFHRNPAGESHEDIRNAHAHLLAQNERMRQALEEVENLIRMMQGNPHWESIAQDAQKAARAALNPPPTK